MPSARVLTPPRRVALAGLLAIGLLATPLWVPALHLDDPSYTYERFEVVVDEEEGITYANESAVPSNRQLSDRLGCTHTFNDFRLCGFERQLRDNGTVPSGWYTSRTGSGYFSEAARYQYLQFNGTTYEALTWVNESRTNEGGSFSLDLTLEPRDRETVLEAISRDATEATALDVDPTIVDAAVDGSARSHEEIDVPATVFAVQDGFYRVHVTEESNPAATGPLFNAILFWGGPLLGLGLLLRIRRYVDVQYTKPDDSR